MTLVVVDCGSGNLRSVRQALNRCGASPVVTQNPDVVRRAERVILPGQGAFAACMAGLAEGLQEALEEVVRQKPFLGICVGLQLMAQKTSEHGYHKGFGWLKGEVVPITGDIKIPHMGWNDITVVRPHPVLKNLPTRHAYFVHSYAFVPEEKTTLLAHVKYGSVLCAAAGRDNTIGVQFHPEKSQRLGLTLLDNFLRWKP